MSCGCQHGKPPEGAVLLKKEEALVVEAAKKEEAVVVATATGETSPNPVIPPPPPPVTTGSSASETVDVGSETWDSPVYVDENGPVRMGSVGQPEGPTHPAQVRVERFEAGTFVKQEAIEITPPLQMRLACQDGVCLPWVRLVRDPRMFRAMYEAAKTSGPVESAKAMAELLRPFLAKQDQEVFLCVCLDVQRQVRSISEVCRGRRDGVEVSTPDVLRLALAVGASYVLVVHNHPSGHVRPSKADDALTVTLVRACEQVRVGFMDHLIIGTGGYYSYEEAGKIPVKA
jgi:proteasome lid subunit RPN8/RPN11